MNNVLAVDTSSRSLKLALSFGSDRIIKSEEVVEQSHGQFIVTKFDALFQSAALTIEQLEAIVACTGPGSFTGLRIGLAAAKGIAVALGIPVVGVNLFEVAALRLQHIDRPVQIVIPLNRDECFTAVVKSGKCDEQTLSVAAYTDATAAESSHSLAGIGTIPDHLLPRLRELNVLRHVEYDGADLLHLGREKLSTGRIGDLSLLEPLYVQKSQAEIRFEQRQKRQ